MPRIALLGVLILLGACTSWQSKPAIVPAEAAAKTPIVETSERPKQAPASAPAEASTAATSSPATASDTPATAVPATPASAPKPVEPNMAAKPSSMDKPTTPRPRPVAEREPALTREGAKPTTTAPKPARTTPARTKPARTTPAGIKPAQNSAPKAKPAPNPATNVAAINGRVSLSGGRGQQIDAGDVRDTVVYFVPDSRRARPAAGRYNVYTHNRDFSPAAMVVAVGSTVEFTNLDEIRHNVFSVTPGSSFDLGYQGNGDSGTVTFDKPGVVLAGCNVHRGMHAEVLVLGSRYATRVDANGGYKLNKVPAVPGTLYFWHPRAQLGHQQIRPPFSPSTQKLIAIKPAVPVEIHLAN